MPKYYAVGGVIDLLKPKMGFFGGIEGPYQKISYEMLEYSLYQNFRSRCGTFISNQQLSHIYLFRTIEDARIFSTHRQNTAYLNNSVALSPVFSIEINDCKVEFENSRLVNMPLETSSTAAEIHLVEEKQLDNFLKQASYKNSYAVIKKEPLDKSKIFYIHENGEYQQIQVDDMEIFWKQYAPICEHNLRTGLTYKQVNEFITKNGGHIPDYSFKKKAAEVLEKISWAAVRNSEFGEFKTNCTIEDIELPGYIRNNKRVYYQKHIDDEVNRPLIDSDWWSVFKRTFWWSVFLIPIFYTIGRLWNQHHAQTVLQAIDEQKNHYDKERWSSGDQNYNHCILKIEPKSPIRDETTTEDDSILSSDVFDYPAKRGTSSNVVAATPPTLQPELK